MSKIAVAVFNRKGGVGKTTIAVILAQIALVRHQRVLAIDLDPSGNFTSAFGFLKNSSFKDYFRTKNTLEDSDADAPEDWIVIDCPPSLDEASEHAMDFADIIVVPVRPDYFSLSPLGLITSMAEKKYGKSRSQLPLVKLGFDNSSMSKVANQIITDSGYPVAEDVSLHKSIPYNITTGRVWSMGLTARCRRPYEVLYEKINAAVERMGDGLTDVHEVWAERSGEEE